MLGKYNLKATMSQSIQVVEGQLLLHSHLKRQSHVYSYIRSCFSYSTACHLNTLHYFPRLQHFCTISISHHACIPTVYLVLCCLYPPHWSLDCPIPHVYKTPSLPAPPCPTAPLLLHKKW